MGTRRLIANLMIGLLAATALVPVGLTTAERPAAASSFDPGNIISDGVFFNSGAMDAGAIQGFLNSRVRTCTSGYVCVKEYRQDTWTRAADPMCRTYSGAPNESAATIVAKVGAACGINPQVLLVLLEKEQSLIRDTSPTARQYRSATGYGCPDTAPCDSQYYGFYNQVYMAAWAFKRYMMPSGTGPGTQWYTRYDLMYPVGRTTNILYNPRQACGTQSVYVQNQATHVLYVYTPYVPNQAALNAGYGTGDSCSAYGNRNFFLLFRDWFGATNYSVTGAIGDYYRSIGGAGGVLGEPTGAMQTVVGGWRQNFERGVIFARNGAPVRMVKGSILGRYDTTRLQTGALGWPTGDETTVSGGWTQAFQNGTIFASAAGAFEVKGAIAAEYLARASQGGSLGWPIALERSGADGWSQDFAQGTITFGTTGPAVVEGGIRATYVASGGAAGPLGVATGSMREVSRGWTQSFTNGVIAAPRAGEVLTVSGPTGRYLLANGGVAGRLGWPTGAETVSAGLRMQAFDGGSVISSTAGTYTLSGVIGDYYRNAGGASSFLGLPTSEATSTTTGSGQAFQFGYVTVLGGRILPVRGAIATVYRAQGGVTGPLGLPTANESTVSGGGWRQTFEGGQILSSRFGDRVVPAALGSFATATPGGLGWPVAAAEQRGGVVSLEFERGLAVASTQGAFPVVGSILNHYRSRGTTSGPLGAPTGAEVGVSGGWTQSFAGGRVFVRAGSPGLSVQGAIGELYLARSAQSGALGWPVAAEQTVSGGWRQFFDNGVIVSSANGTHSVQGSIGQLYRAANADRGDLGFAVGPEVRVDGGWTQRFAGGLIAAGPRGTFLVKGAIGQRYIELGAQQAPNLGWPIGPETRTSNGWSQTFQFGRIVVDASGTSVQR